MVRIAKENLTPLGQIIHDTGLSLNYIIEKSGLTRNRLVLLRTNHSSTLSFKEARQIAPVLRMSLDELGAALDAKAAMGQE